MSERLLASSRPPNSHLPMLKAGMTEQNVGRHCPLWHALRPFFQGFSPVASRPAGKPALLHFPTGGGGLPSAFWNCSTAEIT